MRLQLEQRKAGRQYSASELAEIKKQNAERQSLNLQRGMQDQAWGSYIDILKRTGNGKQAEMETALRNAERTKGGKLTNEETELVKRPPTSVGKTPPFRMVIVSFGGNTLRAWGRRLFACSLKKRVGNTPTGVGKTR